MILQTYSSSSKFPLELVPFGDSCLTLYLLLTVENDEAVSGEWQPEGELPVESGRVSVTGLLGVGGFCFSTSIHSES